MTKNEWRAFAKEQRRAIPEEERIYQTLSIIRHIEEDPRWECANTVLLFLSFGTEWKTMPLIESAWRANKTVALTVTTPDKQLLPARFDPTTPLVQTIGHLREIPFEDAVPVDINTIDFCLIPGLLFDPYGMRLGYGSGYYDRFLPLLPEDCTMLAAGFDCQLIGDALPSEETDFHIPEVLTPSTHIFTQNLYNPYVGKSKPHGLKKNK